MKVKQTNSFIAPSTVRQDNELPFLKQSVYSDGTSGWMSGMQGVQNLTPPVLKQIQGEAFRQIGEPGAERPRPRSDSEPERPTECLRFRPKMVKASVLLWMRRPAFPRKLAYQQSPAEGGTRGGRNLFGLARCGWASSSVPMDRDAERQEVRQRYGSGLQDQLRPDRAKLWNQRPAPASCRSRSHRPPHQMKRIVFAAPRRRAFVARRNSRAARQTRRGRMPAGAGRRSLSEHAEPAWNPAARIPSIATASPV